MTLEKALELNPYNEQKGNVGAYIRYLRYNVDGFYEKESLEIRKILQQLNVISISVKETEKIPSYVWVWVKNPYATDMNNKPEKELRRYRVKERKQKCIVLYNGKMYPYSQCYESEEMGLKKQHKENNA